MEESFTETSEYYKIYNSSGPGRSRQKLLFLVMHFICYSSLTLIMYNISLIKIRYFFVKMYIETPRTI